MCGQLTPVRTAITWAARRGHEGVVRMLLEQSDVNPNAADTQCSQTPLLWAARNGHERVVRIFLERNDVNPNTADTRYGRTPVGNRHTSVAKLLQEPTDLVPRYLASPQSTELFSPESSELSEPPPGRIHRS